MGSKVRAQWGAFETRLGCFDEAGERSCKYRFESDGNTLLARKSTNIMTSISAFYCVVRCLQCVHNATDSLSYPDGEHPGYRGQSFLTPYTKKAASRKSTQPFAPRQVCLAQSSARCEFCLLLLHETHHIFMTKQPEFALLDGWQFPFSYQLIDIIWAATKKVGHIFRAQEQLLLGHSTCRTSSSIPRSQSDKQNREGRG